MSPIRLAHALLLLATLFLATPATADPRWWWNDLRLTDTPTASITPHLVAPGYATGGAGGSAVFIVWSEVDAAQGDHEVWMTATFDGGCSFCAATRLTDNAVEDAVPRVAVLALPEGTWSFGVAFESGDQVAIAWDSTTVSFRVPFEQLCAELADLGPNIIAGGKYVRFAGGPVRASLPDIVAVGTPAFGHFHAAWQEVSATSLDISYAHDLTARGGLGWRLEPPKVLSPQFPRLSGSAQPAIAADLATDPDPLTGNVTSDRSAVDVVWVELLPTDESRLVSLRSTDSGATFSPTGARVDAPAEAVSDASGPTDVVARPSIDAAFNSFTTMDPAWVATAWDDLGTGGGVAVQCDARHLDEPATPIPDWQAPDELVSTAPGATEGDTSIALTNAFNAPVPAWLAWESSAQAPSEITYRGGMLNRSASDVIDFARFPYTAARALDPAASEDFQLTHCAFEPATFACTPTRTAGEAIDIELDASEFATYAVWSDTRDGQAEIYFKRTDRSVFNTPPRLSTGCGPLGDAWIDVVIDQVVTCPRPFAGERMTRYLVFHGTDPGGPYANAASPVELLHDPAVGPTLTVRITGLSPGTLQQVVVVPEDEARNVSPPAFDPTEDGPVAHQNEASIVTADPCVAAQICLWRFDVTSLRPHAPAREDVYLVPPSPEDVHLQGVAHQCPFGDGDLERDGNAATNGVPLLLYQVNRPIDTLRLARSGATIRFRF